MVHSVHATHRHNSDGEQLGLCFGNWLHYSRRLQAYIPVGISRLDDCMNKTVQVFLINCSVSVWCYSVLETCNTRTYHYCSLPQWCVSQRQHLHHPPPGTCGKREGGYTHHSKHYTHTIVGEYPYLCACLPTFYCSPSPIPCNETSVLSSRGKKLLGQACCLLYNKPQASAFNHMCLGMITDKIYTQHMWELEIPQQEGGEKKKRGGVQGEGENRE